MTKLDVPILSIHALFNENGATNPSAGVDWALLRQAHLIVGHDWMSQRDFILYGRELLDEIARTTVSRKVAVFRLGLDQETEELEQAVALVKKVKGRCDYIPAA